MTWLKKGLESCSETNFSTSTKLFRVPAFLLNIREEKLEMPTIIPLKEGKERRNKKAISLLLCVSW